MCPCWWPENDAPSLNPHQSLTHTRPLLPQISLRTLFPDANVSMLVAKRPTLLTAAEWPAVVAAHAKLHAMFPEGGVDHMVGRGCVRWRGQVVGQDCSGRAC